MLAAAGSCRLATLGLIVMIGLAWAASSSASLPFGTLPIVAIAECDPSPGVAAAGDDDPSPSIGDSGWSADDVSDDPDDDDDTVIMPIAASPPILAEPSIGSSSRVWAGAGGEATSIYSRMVQARGPPASRPRLDSSPASSRPHSGVITLAGDASRAAIPVGAPPEGRARVERASAVAGPSRAAGQGSLVPRAPPPALQSARSRPIRDSAGAKLLPRFINATWENYAGVADSLLPPHERIEVPACP